MKIKVAIASLAVVAIAVVAFAFTPAKRVSVTYNYESNKPYQRLLWNTNPLNLLQKSIDKDANIPPYFRQVASWTKNPVSFTPSSSFTDYIGSITFNEEFTADGGSDNELTIQEAIDQLHNSYMTNQVMPSSLTVDSVAQITVTPATAAH